MNPSRSAVPAAFQACLIAATAIVTTAAEEVRYPISIAVNKSGVVCLADRKLPGVWLLDGDRVSLHFRGPMQNGLPLSAIRCVAFDHEGRLLAGDSSTRQIYRFDAQGKPHPVTAESGGLGQIEVPMDIEVDAEGNLLVSDLEAGQIVSVSVEGVDVRPWVALPAPRGLFLDSRQRLWAISGRTLVCCSAAGDAETVVGDGVFQFPNDVAVDQEGVAYVSDGHRSTIWRIVPGHDPEPWLCGEPLDNPVGMTFSGGKLLVVDPRANAVFEIDRNGELSRHDLGAGASTQKKAGVE